MIVVFFIFRIDCSSCSISSGMYYSKGSSKAYHQCCNKAGNTVSQSVIQSVGSPWRAVMKCVTLFIYLFERGMPKQVILNTNLGALKVQCQGQGQEGKTSAKRNKVHFLFKNQNENKSLNSEYGRQLQWQRQRLQRIWVSPT